MNTKVRYTLAGVVGVLTAGTIVYGIEALGHIVYPVPDGVDLDDMEQVKAMIADLPAGAFMFVLAAYYLGTFVGGVLACLVAAAHQRIFAGVVGAFILFGTVMNLVNLPHPLWFSIVAVIGIPIMAFLASIAAKPRNKG